MAIEANGKDDTHVSFSDVYMAVAFGNATVGVY